MASLATATVSRARRRLDHRRQPVGRQGRPAGHRVRRPVAAARVAGRARRGRRTHHLHRRRRAARHRAMVVAAPARAAPAAEIVDLALPHDVDPAVADLPGRQPDRPGHAGRASCATYRAAKDVAGVRAIVAQEIAAFLSARRQSQVTPTVVALRSMATGVVETEMARLDARQPDLDPACARRSCTRCAGSPTSCCTSRPCGSRSWPTRPGAVSYAAALAELFSLDPEAVDAVTRADVSRARSTDDRRTASRHPRLRAGHHPVGPGRDADPRRDSAARSSSSRSAPRATAARARWRQLGGTGVFVSALRDALLAGEVDIAVHSLKDLPTTPAEGITLAAVPPVRTRATSWSPATGSPSASCRRPPASAPAARVAPRRSRRWAGSRRRRHPRQRRHPHPQGRRRGVRRRRPGPRRTRPAGPPRRGHRGARPAPDAARSGAGCARGRVPHRRRRIGGSARDVGRSPHEGCHRGRAGRAGDTRGRVLRTAGSAGRGRRRRGRRRVVDQGDRPGPRRRVVGADERDRRPTTPWASDPGWRARCSPREQQT